MTKLREMTLLLNFQSKYLISEKNISCICMSLVLILSVIFFLNSDLERVREGIGSKFSMVIQYVATFVSGLAVGLYANWRLTVVILGVGPLLIGTSGFLARVAASSAAREQLKYSIAGGIANEVLNCIRTVAAFGAQDREVKRYVYLSSVVMKLFY